MFFCVVLFFFCVVFVFHFIKISKFALPGVMLMYERTSIYRKNRIGPKTCPRGTQDNTGTGSEA